MLVCVGSYEQSLLLVRLLLSVGRALMKTMMLADCVLSVAEVATTETCPEEIVLPPGPTKLIGAV